MMKKILLGLLFGLVICFTSFAVLYKTKVILFSKNEEVKCENNNDDDVKNKVTISDEKSEKLYKEYLSRRKNEPRFENGLITLSSQSRLYESTISATLDSEFNLKLTIPDFKEYTNYLVDKDVIDAFLVDDGNGGYEYLYYITEDGTLKVVCIECLMYEDFKIKTVTDKKYIVSVNNLSDNNSTYNFDSHVVVFKDINGKFY